MTDTDIRELAAQIAAGLVESIRLYFPVSLGEHMSSRFTGFARSLTQWAAFTFG
jgi:hypothetical protein